MRRQPRVRNAADRDQVRRASEEELAETRKTRSLLRLQLSAPALRALTWARLEPIYARVPVVDAASVAFALGRRYDAEQLRDDLWSAMKDEPDLFERYQEMEREALRREREDDAQRQAQTTPAEE